jgi:hypothetical protein
MGYDYIKDLRERRKKEGRCRDCENIRVLNRQSCSVCLEKTSKSNKKRRLRLRDRGICPSCGVRKVSLGYTTCDVCIERQTECKEKRFFQYRATHFNGAFRTNISAKDLWSLWKKQRGRSALTGKRMTLRRRPELDHIIPKSKGGTHDLSNLRWALKLENRAKGNLSDKEFISLCSDVSKFFGGA